MENYIDYFNNLKDFVYKKTIINDISKTYNVTLTNDEYNKIIKEHLVNKVIAKSTNSPGKCAYISQSFLDEHNLDPIFYFKSKKIDSINLTVLTKKVLVNESFLRDDCIQQVTLKELFNEL